MMKSCFSIPMLYYLAILVGGAALLSGCGGALSQDDMRRMGIRRKKDKEDEPAVVSQPTPTSAPTASRTTSGATPSHEPVDQNNHQTVAITTAESDAYLDAQDSSATNVDLSDTRKPPTEPLSFVDRCRIAGANMDRLAIAMDTYLLKAKTAKDAKSAK